MEVIAPAALKNILREFAETPAFYKYLRIDIYMLPAMKEIRKSPESARLETHCQYSVEAWR